METLVTALRSLKMMEIKPNYSSLSREFGMDRHTIKRMYERMDAPPRGRRPRKSQLEPLRGEIAAILGKGRVTVRAAYWRLRGEGKVRCTYSNFKSFVRSSGIRPKAGDAAAHPPYETPPGDLVQCDWVEGIRLATKSGGEVAFNVFSATLAYSRLHYFEFTETKTEEAFKRCFCHFLRWLGSKPRAMMTDNMSALVSVAGGSRRVHPSVSQFSRDIGVKFVFCRPRSPQTKGKDEAANKYVKWLYSYDGAIGSKEEARALVARLTEDANARANSMTGVPPRLLFQEEKEHLDPLPGDAVLREYEGWSHSVRVPQTQLVYYRGARYSVPKDHIAKTVSAEDDGETVRFFYDGLVIASHALIGSGVSLDEAHLRASLSGRVDPARIDEFIGNTMRSFREMGEREDV